MQTPIAALRERQRHRRTAHATAAPIAVAPARRTTRYLCDGQLMQLEWRAVHRMRRIRAASRRHPRRRACLGPDSTVSAASHTLCVCAYVCAHHTDRCSCFPRFCAVLGRPGPGPGPDRAGPHGLGRVARGGGAGAGERTCPAAATAARVVPDTAADCSSGARNSDANDSRDHPSGLEANAGAAATAITARTPADYGARCRTVDSAASAALVRAGSG